MITAVAQAQISRTTTVSYTGPRCGPDLRLGSSRDDAWAQAFLEQDALRNTLFSAVGSPWAIGTNIRTFLDGIGDKIAHDEGVLVIDAAEGCSQVVLTLEARTGTPNTSAGDDLEYVRAVAPFGVSGFTVDNDNWAEGSLYPRKRGWAHVTLNLAQIGVRPGPHRIYFKAKETNCLLCFGVAHTVVLVIRNPVGSYERRTVLCTEARRRLGGKRHELNSQIEKKNALLNSNARDIKIALTRWERSAEVCRRTHRDISQCIDVSISRLCPRTAYGIKREACERLTEIDARIPVLA